MKFILNNINYISITFESDNKLPFCSLSKTKPYYYINQLIKTCLMPLPNNLLIAIEN